MKRYGKFVFEAEKGITFEVSEGTSGEVIIRALNIDKANLGYVNYANPPILKGYKHICGEWDNGFVIERESDSSQFVWIPIGILDSNGTLDGVSFNEKFGRRNYQNDKFSESGFHETLRGELELQAESVKKYGGFYISRYNISKNKKTGKPQSVKGEMPWINMNINEAKEIAAMVEISDTITSHLTFGAEYDSVLEWFIKSEAKTLKEIVENSTEWGNYSNTKNFPSKMLKTGSNEKFCANNIYDFTGNVCEYTQEQYNISRCVLRGGSFDSNGNNDPAVYRGNNSTSNYFIDVGFRAVLYIK